MSTIDNSAPVPDEKVSPALTGLHMPARVVITYATPVVLTIIFVRLVMSPLFLSIEYNRPGFPADPYGFTTEERLQYAPPAVAYLLNSEGISFLADLRLPREIVPPEVCNVAPEDANLCLMFNERELRHMEDVKVVTRGAFITGIVSGVLAVAGGVLLYRENRWQLKQSLMGGAMLTLALIGTIILMAATAWEVFFTSFHQIFFEGDSWLFRYSDTLIRLFPEQFWFDAALVIGVLTTLSALVILVFSWRWQPTESDA
ncbi:MAG: TIGR01906 family membrane protein, partial [Chloroflexota bacterium]